MLVRDTAIIGAGPAGIAAAIQLKRYGITSTLFEKGSVGGLLRNANLVENYPGFHKGIGGTALVSLLKKHLETAGIAITQEAVESLRYGDGLFHIKTEKSIYSSLNVIVATGTVPLKPDLPDLSDFESDRIFYEVHPLRDVRNKRIAIVGAGDAAFDYSLNLSRCNDVSINNRGDRISCLPLLFERIKPIQAIEYRKRCVLRRLKGIQAVCKSDVNDMIDAGLELHWSTMDKSVVESVDYLLIAIGREPALGFLHESIKENLDALKTEGLLHFVGDVSNGKFRQAGISIGDGIRAAMEIAQKLSHSNK